MPEKLIRPISSAVDKLDKLPWEEVKKEMVEKTLEPEVADKIWQFVQHKGKSDIIELLRKDENMSKNEDIIQGTKDMEVLFDSKVMLNLWVKVKGGWSDDERALRSLGYGDL